MRRVKVPRSGALLVPIVAVMLLVTGCTEVGLQPTQPETVAQPWSEWKHPTTAPVAFSGTTTNGSTFSSADHLGHVLVVNFWYAGCGPCRAEAATLNAAAKEFTEAQFVGVNVSDDAATAASFERTHHNDYPSIVDQEQAAATQLAFAGSRPPKAVPSTLILDRSGRVTARLVGQANPSVLHTLIEDAINHTDS